MWTSADASQGRRTAAKPEACRSSGRKARPWRRAGSQEAALRAVLAAPGARGGVSPLQALAESRRTCRPECRRGRSVGLRQPRDRPARGRPASGENRGRGVPLRGTGADRLARSDEGSVMELERRGRADQGRLEVDPQGEEPTGRPQPKQWPVCGSRMTGDCHVRFCESRGVRFPPATHPTPPRRLRRLRRAMSAFSRPWIRRLNAQPDGRGWSCGAILTMEVPHSSACQARDRSFQAECVR